MKNKMRYTTLFLVSGLMLNACNFRKVERQTHEAPADTPVVARIDDERKIDLQSDPNWLKSIYDQMIKKEYKAVIQQVNATLNDDKLFHELNTKKVSEGTSLLGYYNFSILEELKANPKSSVLDDYIKMALKGCENGLNSCDSLSFLRRDSKSVLVITEAIKQKQANLKIDEYYRLIHVGFEINNQLRTPELEMLYIAKGKDYFDYLDKAGEEQKENKERHTKLFQLILGQNTIDKNNPKMVEWLKQLNPWKFSNSDKSHTMLGANKIFGVAAKNFIYDDKKLSASLLEVIKDNKKVTDTFGISFYESVNDIKKDFIKADKVKDLKILNEDEQKKVKLSLIKEQVLKNLGINIDTVLSDDFQNNEYFYLVDRLFRDHFGIDEANLFWEGTQKKESELDRIITLYSKMELLKMLFKTNAYMGTVFKQKDIPNEKLFEQVVNRSQTLTDDWKIFLGRIDMLTVFVKQKNKAKKSNLAATEKFLDSISRNIKYLAIYPNMMVIGDMMIDLEAEITVASFWGTPIQVKPKEVMKDLINGNQAPWFIFGGDTTPLNKTQTILSYYFGLETGVFDTFSVIKDDGRTARALKLRFFLNAVKRTLSEETQKLKDSIEKLEDINGDKVVEFQNNQVRCGMLEKNDLNFTIPSVPLEDIQKYLLFGNLSDGVLKSMFGLYVSGPIGEYANFRDGYEALVIQIHSMMEVLKLKLATEADAQVVKDLQSEMDSYENLKHKFHKAAVAQHFKVSDCINNMVRMEMDRTLKVYELEIEFFGKVFEAANKLRTTVGADAKKKELEAIKKSLNMGPNDNITDTTFVFSHLSLMNRIKAYNEELKPQVTYDMPNQSELDKLDMTLFSVPLLDLRTKNYFKRDDFVSYALRTISGQSESKFKWIEKMA
jgi:hypothetical protein